MPEQIIYHDNFKETYKNHNTNFQVIDLPKLLQAAEVHGYRGPSNKKRNGIVPIRPTDTGLLKTLHKLARHENLKNVLPIKVVAHVTTGDRLVGYKLADGTIKIYGVANYDD